MLFSLNKHFSARILFKSVEGISCELLHFEEIFNGRNRRPAHETRSSEYCQVNLIQGWNLLRRDLPNYKDVMLPGKEKGSMKGYLLAELEPTMEHIIQNF